MCDELSRRREANRDRVAARADTLDRIPPGFTGAEAMALAKLNPPISTDQGRIEFEGGWDSQDHAHFFDGAAA